MWERYVLPVLLGSLALGLQLSSLVGSEWAFAPAGGGSEYYAWGLLRCYHCRGGSVWNCLCGWTGRQRWHRALRRSPAVAGLACVVCVALLAAVVRGLRGSSAGGVGAEGGAVRVELGRSVVPALLAGAVSLALAACVSLQPEQAPLLPRVASAPSVKAPEPAAPKVAPAQQGTADKAKSELPALQSVPSVKKQAVQAPSAEPVPAPAEEPRQDEKLAITGRVYSTEVTTVDGPGLRMILFLQGCSKRCQFCCNPDTWDPNGGTEKTVEQLATTVQRHLLYISRGGITVSGGEPLDQANFVAAFFERCHGADLKLHTALDTSGGGTTASPEAVKRVLKHTDLVMLSPKSGDPEAYKTLTGGTPQDEMLRFAELTRELGVPLWLRWVLVPEATDLPRDIEWLIQFAKDFPNLECIDVLQFHQLGKVKWDKAGIAYPMADVPPCTRERATEFSDLLPSANLSGIYKVTSPHCNNVDARDVFDTSYTAVQVGADLTIAPAHPSYLPLKGAVSGTSLTVWSTLAVCWGNVLDSARPSTRPCRARRRSSRALAPAAARAPRPSPRLASSPTERTQPSPITDHFNTDSTAPPVDLLRQISFRSRSSGVSAAHLR
eukprot:m51a1_g12196 putative pyruvate formate lyase-activating protein (608) ;mRNA; f:36600-40020